jgi:hypothetical protein
MLRRGKEKRKKKILKTGKDSIIKEVCHLSGVGEMSNNLVSVLLLLPKQEKCLPSQV